VVLELEPALPLVLGHEGDVRRLCRFLLANALRALAGAETGRRGANGLCADGILLHVEDAGPDVPVEALPHLFEPGHEQREGMCCLELACGSSIVRDCKGPYKPRLGPAAV